MPLLPVFTLLLIFLIYQKKNNRIFGSVSYLLTVYIVMGIFSIIMHYSGFFPSVLGYSFEAMSYLSISFIVCFYGFFNYRDNKVIKITIKKAVSLKILENILIAGGFSAILFFLPFAIKGLTGNIQANRLNVSEMHENVLAGYGIINSIFSLLANLFILAMALSFINFAKKPRYHKRAYLLLLSSLSYVVYVLAYVGRDGVAYWILSFLFIYFLMKDFLNVSIIKRIRKFSVITFVIITIPFILISIGRFGSGELGSTWQIINYMGQQIKNFNDAYQVVAPLSYGRSIFPVFVDFLEKIGFNFSKSKDSFEIQSYFLSAGVLPWTFRTYIGSFLSNFGKLGTLLLLLLLSYMSRSIIKNIHRTGAITISRLILFILFYQTVLWGVFYFRLYSANFYIIAMLILSLIFKLGKSNMQPIQIYKLNSDQ